VVQVKSAQIFSGPSSGIHTREEPARLASFDLILVLFNPRQLAKLRLGNQVRLPPRIRDTGEPDLFHLSSVGMSASASEVRIVLFACWKQRTPYDPQRYQSALQHRGSPFASAC
jgi:hypothetical protein